MHDTADGPLSRLLGEMDRLLGAGRLSGAEATAGGAEGLERRHVRCSGQPSSNILLLFPGTAD